VGTNLRVLLLEDDPDDAKLVEMALSRGGYEPSIVRVSGAVAMSDALDREPWDVVISDYSMPTFDAPAALSLLQAHDLDIPFIIVSGTVGEHAAVTAMKAGAHDYLNKSNLKRLAPAVGRELGEARRRAESRRAEETLRAAEARERARFESLVARMATDVATVERELAQLLVLLDTGAADGKAAPAREVALRIREVIEGLKAAATD